MIPFKFSITVLQSKLIFIAKCTPAKRKIAGFFDSKRLCVLYETLIMKLSECLRVNNK